MPPERRRRRRRRPEPAAVGDLVARVTARAGVPTPGGLPALAGAWAAAVGDAAALRSLPIRRSRAGVVTVACADATWAYELRARQEEIVERLRAEAPREPVASLRFVIADHAVPPAPPAAPAAPPPPVPGPAQEATAAGMAAAVGDPELRAVVARAIALGLARSARPGGVSRSPPGEPR